MMPIFSNFLVGIHKYVVFTAKSIFNLIRGQIIFFFLLIFAENHLLSKHVGLWSLCFCGWKSVLPMTKTEYFLFFPINIMYISNYVSVQDTRYNKIILIKGASYFFISVGLQNRPKIGKIGHKRA